MSTSPTPYGDSAYVSNAFAIGNVDQKLPHLAQTPSGEHRCDRENDRVVEPRDSGDVHRLRPRRSGERCDREEDRHEAEQRGQGRDREIQHVNQQRRPATVVIDPLPLRPSRVETVLRQAEPQPTGQNDPCFTAFPTDESAEM
jgi:hypothetical protein